MGYLIGMEKIQRENNVGSRYQKFQTFNDFYAKIQEFLEYA